MEQFIKKLKELNGTLTEEEKETKLYFYISNNLKREFGQENEKIEYFYINDEESHKEKNLTCEYPPIDLVHKLLILLDGYEAAECLYLYEGEKEKLIEKINIVSEELPNIIINK